MATYTDNYNLIKPTYSEVADVATINTNMNTIDDIMHSTQVSLAPAYDSTQTYNTGDVVMYELLMYKCKENGVTGTWNASKWERTTASECGDSGSDVEVTQIQTEGKAIASIAVDGVSTDILVPELKVYGEASGSIAEFDDGSNKPMSKCKIDINAVQDLHGYNSPWVGGSGKNKFDISKMAELEGVTVSGDTFTGLARSFFNSGNILAAFNAPAGTTLNVSCTAKSDGVETSGAGFALLFVYSDNTTLRPWYTSNSETSFTNHSGAVTAQKDIVGYKFADYNSGVKNTWTVKNFQIELGSTATSYAPYSNICPISGFSEGNVHVSPTTNAQDGTTYSVSWQSQAGTVYGGNVDLVSGVLTVTHANIASYDGETLPSTWISDRDVYSVGGTPTTGAQVVYELATPLTYQLTPIQVNSLLGINKVWNDTNGETEVKYRRDIEMLLQRIADSLGGNQ